MIPLMTVGTWLMLAVVRIGGRGGSGRGFRGVGRGFARAVRSSSRSGDSDDAWRPLILIATMVLVALVFWAYARYRERRDAAELKRELPSELARLRRARQVIASRRG